jgi:hypothetical protein
VRHLIEKIEQAGCGTAVIPPLSGEEEHSPGDAEAREPVTSSGRRGGVQVGANFAINDPPLKLVLNSPGNGAGGTINHLGIGVSSTAEVTHAAERLAADGLATEAEPGATCCYARQDKVWAHDPDGLAPGAERLPAALPGRSDVAG